MKHVLSAFLVLAIALPAAAQSPTPSAAQSAGARPDVLRVFLDCNQCDFNNLRQDITFINYVRDRNDADVHVLVTTQGTGSRGRQYTFEFIGLGAFADLRQTLTYSSSGTDTDDERRQGVARTFSLGLTPYLLRTASADQFSLRYEPPNAQAAAAPAQGAGDPWNAWIFRVGASAQLDGEQAEQSRRYRTNVSANRTTDRWKLSFSGNGDFNEDEFTLSDGRTIVNTRENYNANASVIKSLGADHWGGLLRTSWSHNTQTNHDRNVRVAAGVEYDVFSYAESTRRSLVFQYSTGVNFFDYTVVTLYGKLRETAADQRFAAILALRQPWGTSRVTGSFQHYLNDLAKHRLEVNGEIDVRLFRGFGLTVEGNASRVRDQLYLPAGEATDEEILLRQRRLATGYRYGFQIGFSYQFGSIYNNVVNPRWGNP
ncbi:MAG: hypothetical protein R2752_06235 [Vicinamibacterales bacterium]